MSERIKIAIYMRLSKEDAIRMKESNSISIQRILLTDYASTHFDDYELLEFQDDGYSGTNFNRPGISALIRLIDESSVDCIIVKDFSRFSRDYIELGTYIEHIFPIKKIRFISLGDSYDSAEGIGKTEDIGTSFKNLLYDFYSKDLSVKVKTSLAVRKGRGEYVSANSPFGYEKAPNDRHMLLIEEDEAEIVRQIFSLTLEGLTSVQIARSFNANGIRTPIQFKIEKGKTTRVPKGDKFVWSPSVICQILRNEVYVGDIVYGKFYKVTVGGKKYLNSREDWKIYRNHHQPVIERQIFNLIQLDRGGKKLKGTEGRHPLQGKLICSCCRKNLIIRKGLNPYFKCPSLYTDLREGCVQRVNAMFLEQYVLHEIQNRVQTYAVIENMQKVERQKADRGFMKWENEKQVMLENNRFFCDENYNMVKSESEKHFGIYTGVKSCIINQERKNQLCLNETENALKSNESVMMKQCTFDLSNKFCFTELTVKVVQKLIKNIVIYNEDHIEISWYEFCSCETL